ncbi:zinc finger protein 839 isoform X2 [Stegostoma tigrinum]|uniref:zinc finger protein 839 isoform X2 n=1 Tax=Stegostoma tigrinum TaxID=3053191 RepID=UPI00287000B1|nr:zinc finger protein 839 isoform X2 [Stegostoma tigrinum]
MADDEENKLAAQDGAAPQQHGTDCLETLVQQSTAAAETGCVSVPCKQFDTHSCQVLPEEIVQVVVGGGGGEEPTQAVSTLADVAGGLLTANGIINSLAEAPAAGGTVAAVSAGDFAVAAEELESISIESTPSTIIYVQPDGTFVEGTGLTPEEQQQLVEQLAKQQGLVEVSESEAAQMFGSHHQQQQEHAQFVQHVGLTDDLQQVITHVTKSQQQATQFSKNSVVQLNSEPAENQILQKISLASYVPPETRVLSTDQHQMLQVPECNAMMQQMHASVHPSQVVQRIDSCNPTQTQQINISTQSPTVNRPSQPKILTAVSQQQAVFTQPLTVIHNATRQLQNAAHQAALQQSIQQSIARAQQKMAPLRVTPSTQHQLETVQVHIQTVQPQEEKDRPMPPLAVVQPKPAPSSQLANKRTTVSGGVNISGPQIIRIQPISTSGTQQYILHSSSEPPIQLLVQRQPPPLAPVNAIRVIPGVSISGQSGIASTSVTAITTAVGNSVCSSHTKKHEPSDKSKEKKPVKIKTRSGRISRPPKYKVKDYKFIKTEDLAEGHQSDSDDYSEYSFDEEDVKTKVDESSLSIPCSFKPKKFKCDTCEKSYIGRGGLARHYRLNPTHGQLASVSEEQRTSVDKSNGNVIIGGNGDDKNGQMAPELVVSSVGTDTTSVMVDSTAPSSQDFEQTEKVALARHFPGRRRTVRRGRPPKHHNNAYQQDQVLKRKARLKELLKQCDDEELMELALPRLTKVITLWEFLLMKVEKGRPARPQFSDVYREFEMLHKHVKKMADEHLSSSIRMTNPQQPLQISCTQVAESLGITEYTNKENQQDASMSLTYRLVTVDDQNHLNSSGEKHSMERDFGALSPSSKRMKIDDSVTVTETNFNQNGIEISGEVQLQNLTTEEGQKQTQCPTLNSSEAQPIYGPADVPVFDKHTDDGVLVSENNMKRSSSVEHSTSEELCYQVSQVTLSSTQLPLLEQHNEVLNSTIESQDDFLAMDTDITAEELVQEQLSYQNIPEQLNDTQLTTVQSEDEITGQNSLLSDVDEGNQKASEASNSVQVLQHQLGNQDPLDNPEQAEQLNDSDIADQMQQLEKALSHDVEVCSSESNHLQQHQPEQILEADISTEVDLAGQVSPEELNGLQVVNQNKIIGHFEQNADQRNQESPEDILESTVTENGALEFQLPVGSQELLAQGHEQIFIQTSEGLIVSHEGTAVVSQTSEGIVIVTNADGTTMHIRTPDGVPFETVEALLAMDSEGQSEGLLVTQTPTEVEQ